MANISLTNEYTVPRYSRYLACGEYKAKLLFNIEVKEETEYIYDANCAIKKQNGASGSYQVQIDPILAPGDNGPTIKGYKILQKTVNLQASYIGDCSDAFKEQKDTFISYVSDASNVINDPTYTIPRKVQRYKKPEFLIITSESEQFVKYLTEMNCGGPPNSILVSAQLSMNSYGEGQLVKVYHTYTEAQK